MSTRRGVTFHLICVTFIGVILVDAHFGDKSNVEDEKHLKRHLEEEIDVKGEWTKQEIRFHYFKLNDKDNDNLISGNEVVAAIVHEQEEKETKEQQKLEEKHRATLGSVLPPPLNRKLFTDEELETEADFILKDMDLNGDGFIDYFEYSKKVDL